MMILDNARKKQWCQPLRLHQWRVLRILYCPVVPYAFCKSRKTGARCWHMRKQFWIWCSWFPGQSRVDLRHKNPQQTFERRSIIFWDMTLCGPFSCTQRFRGTYRLHFQGRRWRWDVSPTCRVQLNGLHGVISQKMIFFITTAVKTKNPTFERRFLLSRIQSIW
jgi:hypothetical protein